MAVMMPQHHTIPSLQNQKGGLGRKILSPETLNRAYISVGLHPYDH
jgi:hypothetical protein